MKKVILFLVLVTAIGLLSFSIFAVKKSTTATIKNNTFSIDIAKSQSQQEIGLAKYQKLEQNMAMYFPFDHADYFVFWMKDMHFPMDIIFIENGKIVTIYNDVKPEKDYQDFIYKPTAPSNAVLEINAGLSRKYGFRTGDNVIISY